MKKGPIDRILGGYADFDQTAAERFARYVRLRVLLLPGFQLLGVIMSIVITYWWLPSSSFRTFELAALYGALGAVSWSLTELIAGAPESPGHFLWFVSRPIAGAVVGVVVAAIVVAGLDAFVGTLPFSSPSVELASAIFALAAGYRWRTFYELAQRLTKVIFTEPAGSDH